MEGGWLGEAIDIENVDAVEHLRQDVFGGLPEEPLKHLGEAETCWLLREPVYADSWWVTEDGDAHDYGVRSGLRTLRTFEALQHIVADGDLRPDQALALMRAMVGAGRNLLYVPSTAAEFG